MTRTATAVTRTVIGADWLADGAPIPRGWHLAAKFVLSSWLLLAALHCTNSRESSGLCAAARDFPPAGETIVAHAVASCDKAIGAECYDMAIDAGSPCELCISLLSYQSGEIAAAFKTTFRDAGITAEDVARMMNECMAKAADCDAMTKCSVGAFLYACPRPPCSP
jgi:hypothetical protein